MAERPEIFRLRDVVEANLAGGWAGNTDQQVETWLLANDTKQDDISHDDLMTWLARTNGINKLELAKSTGTTDNVKSAAAYLLVLANAGVGVRLSVTEVRGFLGNLIPEIFTTAERDDILAFSNETVTRARIYNVPYGLGAIARARAIS